MSFLAGDGPRWFTIPAQRPFLADLARGLLDALPGEALSEAVVLLPSRRSVRMLAEAFVDAAGGGAMILPQVRALGDLDEGEPPFEPGGLSVDIESAISPWRRRFELAGLAAAHSGKLDRRLDSASALQLGDALAALIDSLALEESDGAARIDRLVEGDLARHWQLSADFLEGVLGGWEARLKALGRIDLSARRVRLLRALAESWERRPPTGPLIAAGSTGTAPANAALLKVIAELPKGAVVLPGLDLELADSAWDDIEEQHPQSSMKRLVEPAGGRGAVRPWPASPDDSHGRWRRRIVNEALRPAEATRDWIGQIAKLQDEGAAAGIDPFAEGLKGLSVIAARDEEQAARAAALLLREVLETPGRTAALITPDQALARRVSAILSRWGVEADTSAGAPLAGQPTGVLMALLARAVVDPGDPVALLAILKHPFVRLGLESEEMRAARRALERHALRGARRGEVDWIERRLADAALPRDTEAEAPAHRIEDLQRAGRLLGLLRAAIDAATAPYTGGTATPGEAARALAAGLEMLAADEAGDAGNLWAGPAGEAAAALVSALIGESEGLPEDAPDGFAETLERMMAGEVVRAARAAHPRLQILGAIESRLVGADRLVLAGLEEGVWPQGAPIDPFLSRPMRHALDLPPPERRIGLSAHDFAQAACAPEVILLHAGRREGAPAVESRWLWRLRTLARGAGLGLPARPEVLDWADALDEPGPFSPAPRPRPTPPVEARPNKLSVTRIETWVRDPYAVYARHVLRLRPMERPDEPVEARARGTAIHKALETFAKRHPDVLPENAEIVFETLLVEALEAAGMPGPAMARERALAAHAAPWLIEFERARRSGATLLIEQQGELTLTVGSAAFTLTARADRLELREGRADVLDFKTGQAPSKKQMQAGLAPQLTLTGAILAQGGFRDAGAAAAGELVYVRLTGARKAGEVLRRAEAAEGPAFAEAALEGLRRRIEQFQSPETPYVSWATPQFMYARGGDYDHLARVWEWHVIGEAESGDGGGS